ncbi:hypothetical protein [Endozoicomonas sp. 2B-B]
MQKERRTTLEFKSESVAAAVSSFLNSEAGNVLQHKISYGAVQPQIGQDELLKLPIPQFILDAADELLAILKDRENCIRACKALTQAAKFLVEALIEGQLTEQQLIQAESSATANRALLERLKTDGFDGKGEPLFPDIDQLEQLLEEAADQ